MPVRSLNSSVLKWPSLKTVDRAVRSWTAEQVKERSEIIRLGYFGSYARGDWGVGSDLDLIAVVHETSEPFERRSLSWDLPKAPRTAAGGFHGDCIDFRMDKRFAAYVDGLIPVLKTNSSHAFSCSFFS